MLSKIYQWCILANKNFVPICIKFGVELVVENIKIQWLEIQKTEKKKIPGGFCKNVISFPAGRGELATASPDPPRARLSL